MTDLKNKILEEIQNSKIFDTHEHFGHDGLYNPSSVLSLEQILHWSYIGLKKQHYANYTELCEEIQKNRVFATAAFASIRFALKSLYEIDIYPISPKKMENLEKKIQNAYSDSSYIFRVLEDQANVQNVILDIQPEFWKPWHHKNKPIFEQTIRIDEVICPFIKIKPGVYSLSKDVNQIAKYAISNSLSIETLEDFEEALEKYLETLRKHANVIKIGVAYQRTLNFQLEENEDGKIRKIYSKMKSSNSTYSEKENQRWGNYILTILLGYATIERIPVQIHTGLATMKETSPLFLLDIMEVFSSVQFDLFHGGYPFHETIPGILSQRNNAFVDLCWLPIISQNATRQLLKELIEWQSVKKVCGYGGDCIAVEGSLGALFVLKDILAEVLADFIKDNRFNKTDAISIAEDILYNNAAKLYSA
ncbi:MAG: amidohydrolase family protein [Candidatus Lokiarchaeota archaeon]|nr:amidohydrolase family protein [Candidatus Lokiarchaeota archaeon]